MSLDITVNARFKKIWFLFEQTTYLLKEYKFCFSLVDEEWAVNLSQQIRETPIICPNCDLMVCGSFITQLEHEVLCKKQILKGKCRKNVQIIYILLDKFVVDDKELSRSDHPKIPANAKKYECEICNQILYLTSTEILKHKKKCNEKMK